MKEFQDKRIVVTGAAEGVGQVIAQRFAAEGARMIIVDIQEPDRTMELLKASSCDNAQFIQCDIRNEAQIIAMAKKVGELYGGTVDVLINNAGFNGKAQLVEHMTLDAWNKTISLNLTGTMLVVREMIPLLRAAGDARIVNTASNVARRGIPYRADYCSSKWAMLGLTQTLALELAKDNIRVNAVCPGPIDGERIEDILQMHCDAESKTMEEMRAAWQDVPMKRFIKPEEVAETILFLASDKSSAMTGQALNVTGGFIMN